MLHRPLLVFAIAIGSLVLAPPRARAECGNSVVEPGEQCEPDPFGFGCCAPDCSFRPAATPCNDLDECTTGETCDALGSCVPEVAGCDDGDPCTFDWCSMAGCTAWPAESDCESGEKSVLIVRDDAGRSLLRWRLTRGEELLMSHIGDPRATAEYEVCVFREGVEPSDRLATQLFFGPGDEWTVDDASGAAYEDDTGTDDGVTDVRLRTGPTGRSKVSLVARGANLPAIDPFDDETLFAPGTGLRIELHNRENGRCWGTGFAAMKRNTSTTAKAKVP